MPREIFTTPGNTTKINILASFNTNKIEVDALSQKKCCTFIALKLCMHCEEISVDNNGRNALLVNVGATNRVRLREAEKISG